MRLFSGADENLVQQPLLQALFCCVVPAGHVGCLQLDTAMLWQLLSLWRLLTQIAKEGRKVLRELKFRVLSGVFQRYLSPSLTPLKRQT